MKLSLWLWLLFFGICLTALLIWTLILVHMPLYLTIILWIFLVICGISTIMQLVWLIVLLAQTIIIKIKGG